MKQDRAGDTGGDVDAHVTAWNDTYARHDRGVWCYRWGEPVPGAVDLTLRDVWHHRLPATDPPEPATPADEEAAHWAVRCGLQAPVPVPGRDGAPLLLVGMTAPELDVMLLLTVADIADVAGVSKATVDSYRYRGTLPAPQVVKGRTPLWTRPVIRHWLEHRPGSGWRSDIYGPPQPFSVDGHRPQGPPRVPG